MRVKTVETNRYLMDTGELSATQAKRKAHQHQGTKKPENAKKSGSIEELTKVIQRCVGTYMSRHKNIVARVHQRAEGIHIVTGDAVDASTHTETFPLAADEASFSDKQQDAVAVLLDTRDFVGLAYDEAAGSILGEEPRGYEHAYILECDDPDFEHFRITRSEVEEVFHYLGNLWRKHPSPYGYRIDAVRKRPEFRVWCDDKIAMILSIIHSEYCIVPGILKHEDIIQYYRDNPTQLGYAVFRREFLQKVGLIASEQTVMDTFADGRLFRTEDIRAAYPETTEQEAEKIFDTLRHQKNIAETRCRERGKKMYLRVVPKDHTSDKVVEQSQPDFKG